MTKLMICWYYSQYSDIATAVKFFVVQYLCYVFMLINVLEKLLLRMHSCYFFSLSYTLHHVYEWLLYLEAFYSCEPLA